MQPERFFHIYCDESRQTAHRFMVLGGVIIDRKDEPAFLDLVREYRNVHRMHSELKWSKVSRGKLQEYERFVDLLFDHAPVACFKAIAIDTHQTDNQTYNRGSKDLGFYKMMYQLLLHSFGPRLRPNHQCLITLDQRLTSRYTLSTLAKVLNNGLRKKYHFTEDRVRHIQATDSTHSDLIQLADVLMGAVGFQANGDDQRPGASEAKIALAQHIAARAGLVDLKASTPWRLDHFSLWYFRFSQNKKNG